MDGAEVVDALADVVPYVRTARGIASNVLETRCRHILRKASEAADLDPAMALKELARHLSHDAFAARAWRILQQAIEAPEPRVTAVLGILLGQHLKSAVMPDAAYRMSLALHDLAELDVEVLLWLATVQQSLLTGGDVAGFGVNWHRNPKRIKSMQWTPAATVEVPPALRESRLNPSLVLSSTRRLEAKWLMLPPDGAGGYAGDEPYYWLLVTQEGLEMARLLEHASHDVSGH